MQQNDINSRTLKKKKNYLTKEESDSKFVTRRSNIVSYESNAIYSVRNEIVKVWKSNLYYYKGAYILVKGNVTNAGNIADQVISCKTKLGLQGDIVLYH